MEEKSDKEFELALFLAIFFGWLGLDHFYLGKYLTGFLKMCSLGAYGGWWILDIAWLISGNAKDGEGKPVKFR